MTASFDRRTRRVLAARAGYRCSFPDCGQLTIGPGANPEEYALTGTAAHILSVSEQGPRGTNGQSNQQRGSIENGIWLCAQHARVVDANRGDKFPSALLNSFREAHEAKIAAEHEGLPYFWIAGMETGKNPIFHPGERFRLTKTTLLVGYSGTGKTTIFRWLDQVGDSSRHWKAPQDCYAEPVKYSVEVHSPKRRIVGVLRDRYRLDFTLDGEAALFNPIAIEIIYPTRHSDGWNLESFLTRRRAEAGECHAGQLDDVELLGEFMDLNPLVIPSLLPYVGGFVQGDYVNLRVVENDGKRRIVGDDLTWKDGVSIHKVSGGMASMAVLDMYIAMARLSSKTKPTLLLLHIPPLGLDRNTIDAYLSFFPSSSVRFQVICSDNKASMVDYAASSGWSIVKLSGKTPNCRIESLSW
ncbi:MAG: hypothetical protein GY835_02780 [bacterium]|nr:hypothetical protein [bacterium]